VAASQEYVDTYSTRRPDSPDARLFPSVVLAVAPAVITDEASSLFRVNPTRLLGGGWGERESIVDIVDHGLSLTPPTTNPVSETSWRDSSWTLGSLSVCLVCVCLFCLPMHEAWGEAPVLRVSGQSCTGSRTSFCGELPRPCPFHRSLCSWARVSSTLA